MYKIATYLSVFLEDEIKWETRLLSLKMESKQYKMRMYSGLSVSPYVFSGVASTGLCLFQLSAKDIKDIICLTGGAAVFLFAVLCLIAGSKKRPGEIRAIYVEEWKRLKAIEEKENKKAEN